MNRIFIVRKGNVIRKKTLINKIFREYAGKVIIDSQV